MDGALIADLIVHLAHASQRKATDAGGLTPAQWEVLRYFARANRFSRTPSAYAAFHGTTRGTASQAIKTLCDKGMLTRSPGVADGRSRHVELTPAGRALLRHDPMKALERAIGTMPEGRRQDLGEALCALLPARSGAGGGPMFGVCATCTHHVPGAGRPAGGMCQLVTAPLGGEEAERLCVHFAPMERAERDQP